MQGHAESRRKGAAKWTPINTLMIGFNQLDLEKFDLIAAEGIVRYSAPYPSINI